MLLKARVTRTLMVFAISFASILFVSLAHGNIFVADLREDVAPVPTEYQPIGLLKSQPDDGKWGTAFLVGACHILTTYHVAFPGYQEAGFVPSSKVKSVFHVGRTSEQRLASDGFHSKAVATPIAWGKYDPTDFAGLHGDWALLKLDDCLGRHYGTMNLEPSMVAHGERTTAVSLAGFPEDRSLAVGMTIERGCFIKDFGPGLLAGIDCAVVFGASGAPILEFQEGRLVVAGIVIRELRSTSAVLLSYSESARNLVLLTEEFISEIKAVLQSEL